MRRKLPLQPLQPEPAHQILQLTLLFLARHLLWQRAADILLRAHIGKQRVLLEEVAHLSLLQRKIDVLFSVKERLPVENNASPVGPLDTGNALERHALAAAGRAEQRKGLHLDRKIRAQMEVTEPLFNIHSQLHHAAPFRLPFFRSSILTASSTAAEIAIFTMTHLKASASLSVRHI